MQHQWQGKIIEMLQLMGEKNASDLHISAGVKPRMRVNGLLLPIEFSVLSVEECDNLLGSIMTEGDRKVFQEQQVLDFSYGREDLGRFRINIYSQRGSMAAAIRRLPNQPPSMESLGLPVQTIKKFCSLSHGLFLVCGPVGSGKTTTLASMIDSINHSRSCHILSIEDPIEYVHKDELSMIHQREIRRDTSNFSDALKYVLREDPNIVVIGEMRDLETISSAITIAETGHLVLATLHTGDTSESISRILDVFPASQQSQISVQLAYALVGAVNQILLPTADNAGRVLATEVMVTIPAVQNLIRENKIEQIYSQIQMGASYGMHSLNQSLAELVKAGRIAKDVAFAKSKRSKELQKMLER